MFRLFSPILSFLLPGCVLLAMGSPAAMASTWSFASGGSYYYTSGSSYGNKVTFLQGSEKLQTFAWSNTSEAPTSGFETAFIRRFSPASACATAMKVPSMPASAAALTTRSTTSASRM